MRRHSAEHIRQQRQRYVKHRYRMVCEVWPLGVPEHMTPGHLAKWNTSCNCWMCNRQNWPDTRPRTVGTDLDFREALLEFAERKPYR